MAIGTLPPKRARRTAPSKPGRRSTASRRRKARKRGPIRRFIRRFWWAWAPMLLVGLAGAGTFTYLYVTVKLPQPNPLAQTSFLFDRDNELLTPLDGPEDRTEIPYAQMPDHLRNAVVAAEDSRFWSHPGVSLPDIVRAAWADILNRRIEQGASTITQQLVRNAFEGVGTERTWTRKAKEAILALKLERELEKPEILWRYLNTIYFGHGAYGVEAAAKTYFGKSARDLNTLESATLAGVISRPEAFDPIKHPTDAEIRRDIVLNQMADLGYLSERRAARLAERAVKTVKPEDDWAESPAAYFIDYTRDHLVEEFGAARTYQGGWRVRTTLDMEWQRAAFQAIWNHYDPSDPRDIALVAIDPTTGAIRAVASKLTYARDQELSEACIAKALETSDVAPSHCQTLDPITFSSDEEAGGTGRQTGSAFKMFTLVAAIEEGISLDSTFSGGSPAHFSEPPCGTPDDPWDPVNYGGGSYGTMDLFGATASSVNTIFAQLIEEVGPEDVRDVAYRLGIHPDSSFVPPYCSITLGAAEVNVLDMTSAFATLAAGGVRHEPTPVESIRGPDRELIWRNDARGRQVIEPNVAWQAVAALEGVVTGGTASGAYFGVPAFGKTGTEDDTSDAWFCGGTTALVTCVWVGHRAAQLPTDCTGGTCAAPVWHDFMVAAHQDLEATDFPDPEYTGEVIHGSGAVASPSPTPSPVDTPEDEGDEDEQEEEPPPPPPTTPPPTTPPPTTPPPTTPPPTTPPPTPAPNRAY